MYLSHLGLDILNVYSTRSKTKEAGVVVPEVHGVNNGLDPHVKSEHQKPKTQPKPARSAPSLAKNIARKVESKLSKPFVDQLLEWEAEESLQRDLNLSLKKQTSICQGSFPLFGTYLPPQVNSKSIQKANTSPT